MPPPVHGSSMVGQYIKDSNIIKNSFESSFINLSTSRKLNEIDKNPIIKITRYIDIFLKVIFKLLFFQPEIVYLTINAKGLGFFKDLPIAFLVKFFGKKLVLHYHNKGVNLKQNLLFYDFVYRILFKNTKIILLSKKLYFDIKKYVDKKNVFFCPNGIPYPKYEKKIPKNIDIPKIPTLLFLSNIIKSKGVFILLKALKILDDEGVKFKCNFVGGEGDISPLKLNTKIIDFNLAHCVFYLGKKYSHDKYEILQKSDVFLLPTYYHNECFPLVLLEAMQFGLPIITSNEGAISEIVDNNITGFVLNDLNPKNLAYAIKKLINHTEISKNMGKRGKEKFDKLYNLNIFEKKFTTILRKI